MTIVVDASVVVAALTDVGPIGQWAEQLLLSRGQIFAPALMPVEVANVLRRAAASGRIADTVASLAHADLLRLHVTLVDYDLVADRAWALRAAVTSYDACYVAVAESLGAPLATLDQRLVGAPGPTCDFVTPPMSR